MKNCYSVLAGTLTLTTLPHMAFTEGPISANIAFTSDYIWRGTSQTNNGIAIQGGLDYAHESGFYLGVGGSFIMIILARVAVISMKSIWESAMVY